MAIVLFWILSEYFLCYLRSLCAQSWFNFSVGQGPSSFSLHPEQPKYPPFFLGYGCQGLNFQSKMFGVQAGRRDWNLGVGGGEGPSFLGAFETNEASNKTSQWWSGSVPWISRTFADAAFLKIFPDSCVNRLLVFWSFSSFFLTL